MSAPEAPPVAAPRRGSAAAVLLMFSLSGLAALIYQIVWAKQLALVFGVTIYASSAVVTTFMAGLALGSLYFGRVADRWGRPLLLFALLEGGIGLFGACFPLLARAAEPVYVAFYGPFGANHYVMSLVRFALSFVLLIVPTALMGGTLPVLARAYVRRQRRLGGEVAGLYSANNLGAFMGCVLAGYALLEFLGQTGTLHLAAGLNLLVAAGAVALDVGLGFGRGLRAEAAGAEPEQEDEAPLPKAAVVALWVFGIEGFTSLAYQMAWTRLLIFFVATNTYALTAIVATFLVGLSLGAFLVRGIVDRVNPYRLLGIIEVGIGLSALVTIPLLPFLMEHYKGLQDVLRTHGWVGGAAARFAISTAVILVPTTFMGATMPVVSRIYVPALKRMGRRMGVIGCLDTLGSIAGAFVGGFVMIPLLGIQRTIIATAVVNLALGACMFAVRPAGRRRLLLRPAFLVSLALVAAAPLLLLKKRLPLIQGAGVTRAISQGRVLDYHEDVESSVTVLEEYGFALDLFVNGTQVAETTRYDRPSHEMIAHVPLLLHPNPRRALLIGYGIGLTSRAVAAHGVDVDVVELSPGVRRASRWFTPYTGQVLSDPLVHLRIDDGRNYVLGTQRRYDMVQAGIIHPGLNSGNAGFYSVDFYRQCKRILNPGGIVCQWLPLHSIPPDDFRMLVRTFQAEFPHTSIWFKYTTDFCILIGTQESLQIDFAQVERRMGQEEVRSQLARSNIVDVYSLLDSFCAADETVREAIGPGPLNTDERPYVEFHCNRPFLADGHVDIARLLGTMRRPVRPRLGAVPPERAQEVEDRLARWFEGTQALIGAQVGALAMSYTSPKRQRFHVAYQRALELFEIALHLNPEDANARFLKDYWVDSYAVSVAAGMYREGRLAEALARLTPLVRRGEPDTKPEAEARYLYGLIRYQADRARPAAPPADVPQ